MTRLLATGLLALTLASAGRAADGDARTDAEADTETDADRAIEAAIDDAPAAGEIVVTATRGPDRWSRVPYSGTSIDDEEIRLVRSSRTIGDALHREPGVSVQRTASGQVSPFIRGFTGFRTLLLVDGVRLNNSVFREGPNQYWTTVDALTIERLEVVRGPSSVLFGSDAIGGTVNVISRRGAGGEGFGLGGSLYGRGASAERSVTGRLEVTGHQDESVRVLAGITARRYGDLHMGAHEGTLDESGYREGGFDLRMDLALDDETDLTLAWYRFRQPEIPRTHSTRFGHSYRGTTIGTDEQRDLEQTRDLAYARLRYVPDDGALTEVVTTVSYQRTEEEQDRIRAGFSRRDVSGFELHTLGVDARVALATDIGDVTTGFEWYRDWVESFARRYDGAGNLTDVFVQGPIGDDSTYDVLGVYAQDVIALGGGLTLTAGTRFSYVAADSREVADPESGDAISIDDEWTSLVGSLRLAYEAAGGVVLFGGASQGFRAPNLSDLTRLDSARSGEIETPSPGLDPESYVAFELGAHLRGEGWGLDGSVFHTVIDDMIVRFPTGTTIGGEAEVQKANVGDGWVRGIELGGYVDLDPDWRLTGGFSWAEGEADTFPTSARNKRREPLSRVPPAELHCGLRWSPAPELWLLGQSQLVLPQEELNTRDEADTQRIPPDGTPGYTLFHLRGGYRLTDGVEMSLGVENVLDQDYRVHGSGQNGPGRSFVLSVNVAF